MSNFILNFYFIPNQFSISNLLKSLKYKSNKIMDFLSNFVVSLPFSFDSSDFWKNGIFQFPNNYADINVFYFLNISEIPKFSFSFWGQTLFYFFQFWTELVLVKIQFFKHLLELLPEVFSLNFQWYFPFDVCIQNSIVLRNFRRGYLVQELMFRFSLN